jgi:hypothetical protein
LYFYNSNVLFCGKELSKKEEVCALQNFTPLDRLFTAAAQRRASNNYSR